MFAKGYQATRQRLFDHLVGGGEECCQNSAVERFGGLHATPDQQRIDPTVCQLRKGSIDLATVACTENLI
jgi:hypothetical protein